MESYFKQAHFLLSDHEFVDQFENLQLNPSYFTHLAHMRLAWLYIKDFGVERASIVLCDRIKNFDRKFGTGNKFNKTVEYYEKTALSNAILINTTAQQQLINGSINYLEWVTLTNQATNIRNDYIEAVKNLNESIIQINSLINK